MNPIPLILLILILTSCTGGEHGERAGESAGTENSVVFDPLEAIWAYQDNPQTGVFELNQMRPVNSDTLTGEALENIINHT
jgi:hypothetical protein